MAGIFYNAPRAERFSGVFFWGTGVSDDLSLIANNQVIAGFESIRVTRGVERMPSDFDIALTEHYPGEAKAIQIQPGDSCVVKLGDDTVVTGYIDTYAPQISSRHHTVRIAGRSKCADLVDCSAVWDTGQISGQTVLGIAQKLAKPFGITASLVGVEVGEAIRQFNIRWGETPFEIIERLCRNHALLAYDGTDGNLILSRVGTVKAGSALIQGKNVEAASVAFSMVNRFSEYTARYMPMSLNGDYSMAGKDIIGSVTDKGMSRFRPLYLIAETNVAGSRDLVMQRATWECARRFGRSGALWVTVDSWRDGKGALWAPNTLVDLDIPELKLAGKTWCIGEVTYMRDRNGTHAHLMIMHPNAFEPESTPQQTMLPADMVPR